MNPARSLGPALVLGNWTSWWAYLAGPVAGAAISVGIAFILRGRGGGTHGTQAAQGTLGTVWVPTRIGQGTSAPDFARWRLPNGPAGGSHASGGSHAGGRPGTGGPAGGEPDGGGAGHG
jgi:aquaporin Z